MINLSKIDLQKKSVINLKKTSGLGETSKARVVLVLDNSGSMRELYKNGTVQNVVEKLLPFGLAFDDDGSVDFYLFDDGFHELEPITINNLDGYIPNKVFGKYQMGTTSYSPVLKKVYEKFSEKGGFFGWGGSVKAIEPVYVIFITDGNNDDKGPTEDIIKKMSNEGFFIQFIGIGYEKFTFLSKLDDLDGRKIDNVNFFKVNNIANYSDDELYSSLMKEYPEWYKQAKSLNLIK